MTISRIGALTLLLASVACCGLGILLGVTPSLIPLRLRDGTIATPGMGITSAICALIPAVVMALAGVAIWFFVVPEQRIKAAGEAATDRLRAQALHLYMEWIVALQLEQALRTSGGSDHARQAVQTATLALLPELDRPRKRALLQFLYDARLITGDAIVDLNGADLRDIDFQGADVKKGEFEGVVPQE